jgi:hypothetical protein
VTASRPRWAVFYRFVLPFLGLAFCVFTWGLQYKLSLYDPPQAASHEIPKAKLLSRNEQRAATESPLLSKNSTSDKAARVLLFSLIFSFLLALNLQYRPLLVRKDQDQHEPWRLRGRASLTAFFFRPPPALV